MRKVAQPAMHLSLLRQVCLYLLFAICLPSTSDAKFAPPHTVTGRILDNQSDPLAGVSIVLKGTDHQPLSRAVACAF